MLLLSSTEVRVTLVQTVSEIPWPDMFLPLGTFLGKAVDLNVFLRVIGHGSKNGTACCKPRYGTLSQNGYGTHVAGPRATRLATKKTCSMHATPKELPNLMELTLGHLRNRPAAAPSHQSCSHEGEKASSTLRTSQAVPHPSTDRAL